MPLTHKSTNTDPVVNTDANINANIALHATSSAAEPIYAHTKADRLTNSNEDTNEITTRTNTTTMSTANTNKVTRTLNTTILRLAVPSPLMMRLFDYLPLATTQLEHLKPGMRFQVTFGNRPIIAYFITLARDSEFSLDKLKPIIAQIDLDQSCIDITLFKLIQWSADYYHYNIGMCLQAALPKKIRQGAHLSELIEKNTAWRLSHKGLGLSENAFKNAKRQQALICYLRQHTHIQQSVLKSLNFSKSTITALLNKELIEAIDCTATTAPKYLAQESNVAEKNTVVPHSRLLKTAALILNEEQQHILNALQYNTGFNCYLLDGITGSGKTEVYLQSIAAVLQTGKQALVLIPEIALTPQTVSRFVKRFHCSVVNLHSKLNDNQRLKHWQQAKSGTAEIVIGTRSAVFTPFAKLGIIIVDEEHDISYKQQTGFRYSAKDVAVRRAQQLKIPIILGSATPSAETLHNAQQLRYQHFTLKQRANAAQQPKVQLIDIRNQALHAGFSSTLLTQMQSCLNNNEQIIVFINRRGFAPTLLCHSCGWLAHCNHCDARLTVHKNAQQLRCHHCGHRQPLPHQCPECKSTDLRALGAGTQRSESFLQEHFKNTPVIRIDSDSTQNKNSLENLLAQLEPKNDVAQPAILIGTQMLAKGHHFPNVTLVVILNSDAWLFSDDFRGDERMAQLITQVSGRSGRGAKRGNTLIQTHLPEHPFWIQFFTGGYSLLIKNILAQRQATLMPPFAHLCLIHAEHPHAEKAYELLKLARNWLHKNKTTNSTLAHIHSIGPYPSTLARKANHYRFLLQLKHTQRKTLHQTVCALSEFLDQQKLAKKVSWSINIDPQET